ncbi:UNVERIFIED_CONTAM: hypothetical protein PYX00_006443 [Menopon gallinae]|uniref:Major facilitator superfamily (MFS) profile domain-containing protein n=1 Tax=Menopon gallinae TaxID=328185 RepID=A0AAW2HW78_9NEOP
MLNKCYRDFPEPWSRAERRKWLIMLVAGTTAVYASRTSVPLLIPAIAKERNWSRTDSGAVLSSFFWGYTLTQVIGGYLADRIGGQKVILFAAVGWSAVTVAMPMIIRLVALDLEFPLVISARIAHGAFQGAHFPGMSSLASKQLSDKDRAAFFSLATSGSAFGTLLTGLFGSFVLERSNWQSVFFVIGALCCSWTLLFYYMCSMDDRCFTPTENAKVPWTTLFRKPAFWSCVFAHACQNNCFFTLLSWLPTYFHDVFPEAKGWIVNMVPWLFTVPCTLIGKWISERLLSRGFSVTATRKSVEAICLLSQSIGLLALEQINSLEGALVCMVLTIGATGFHNSAVVVNPGDLAPKHSGSVFGLMNTVGSIPGFLGVYAAGEILEKTHSWALVFNVTAAVNILGCLLYLKYASGSPIVQ